MGWASGSELAASIWDTVRPFIPKEKRKEIAIQIVRDFKCFDCDTLYEAETLVADADLPEYKD